MKKLLQKKIDVIKPGNHQEAHARTSTNSLQMLGNSNLLVSSSAFILHGHDNQTPGKDRVWFWTSCPRTIKEEMGTR